MTHILIIIVIILSLIKYLIYADIILSWISLLGIQLRPKFLASIIDPLYEGVRQKITTTFGPLDLTPIIILIVIVLIQSIIYSANPVVMSEINKLPLFGL